MKVYVVGYHEAEGGSVISIHKNHVGALDAWNKLREELYKEAKSHLKKSILEKDKCGCEIYGNVVKNLSCKDPDNINNYPFETPYIKKYDVEE